MPSRGNDDAAMKDIAKNILSFLARFGLSAALLFWLFKKIDVAKMWELLKAADSRYILFAAVIFILINLIILGRWLVIIRAFRLNVPVFAVMRYYFIGLFGNLFLPSSIGGDIIKTLGLCRYTPEKAKVVASVLLDRLSGFGGIVVVATISFAFAYRLINDVSVLVAICAMAVVSFLIVIVLFNEKIYSFCCGIFGYFPKIKKSFMSLHYDVALLKGNRGPLYQMVGISCVIQLLAAILSFYFAKALHQDIALVYFVIFMPLISVASSMPSIGGLGVREAGAVYFFSKIGVASGVAVSIGLMTFVFMVAIGLLGGLIYFVTSASEKTKGA